MKYISRTTEVRMMPEGDPIFSDRATSVRVTDEAAGEFLEVSQEEGTIRVDPEEWLTLRALVDQMFTEIQKYSTQGEALDGG